MGSYRAILLAAVILPTMLLMSGGAQGSLREVIAFDEEVSHISMAPWEVEGHIINATFKNPYPEAATFLLQARFTDAPSWEASVPGRISLGTLDSGTIGVDVEVPPNAPPCNYLAEKGTVRILTDHPRIKEIKFKVRLAVSSHD